MGRLKAPWDRGLTAAGTRLHHTLPLLREIRELRLAAHIDGGMTMSVRSSAAAFVAALALAVGGPLYTGPDGQLLSFPKIPSERIRAMVENQGIIRCDACDPPAARHVCRKPVQVAAPA